MTSGSPEPPGIGPHDIPVLYRDEHLLVVNKPAGLATTSPPGGESLTGLVQALDPDAPQLHPSSRLDAAVTGVVTFARTRRGTKSLLAARKRGAYARLYIALAPRAPSPQKGCWTGVIALDPHDRRRRRWAAEGQPGKPAKTDYATQASTPHVTLLHLEPRTGRTHQLRVHAAAAGVPLLGDVHYGGARRVTMPDGRTVRLGRVMLHCARVAVPEPTGAGMLTFTAPVPDDMRDVCERLSGDAFELSGY